MKPARKVAFDLYINDEQRLYVIPDMKADGKGKIMGYTCLGFDVARERARAYANWLASGGFTVDPVVEPVGSPELYRRYQQLLADVLTICRLKDVRCNVELTPQLMGHENKVVEVVDNHGETRVFKVGRSTGPIPVHLEIEKPTDSGGSATTGAPYKHVRVLTGAELTQKWRA